MSEKKLHFLLVTVFLAAAIASSGCRGNGAGLDTSMPGSGATPPRAALLPFYDQYPAPGTEMAEPDGFSEYGDEPEPASDSAIPIATQAKSNPNLSTNGLDTGPGVVSDERLAVREDSLLTGGTTPGGTRPGGRHLAEPARNNPEAADLLDHWGHRRSQAIKEGLSLTPLLSGSDTFDLQTPRAEAERRSGTTIASNLQDGDEVRILGTRRGVTFGRWAGGPADKLSIDSAFLQDIGITIAEETERPETYGLAGWADYAAFTISVSRDLQIVLADPQPHYGDGSSRWNTLDVIDLLQADVGAFGYLSTSNFRHSHAPAAVAAAEAAARASEEAALAAAEAALAAADAATAEMKLNGTVLYTGGLLGAALDRTGLPPVTGDASLSIDLATLDGTASFTSLTVYPDGAPEVFADGSLHYPIELSANSIVGTGAGSTLQADFYGPKHDDVAGVLHDPQAGLLAGFGATLDERPSREDVIASADYLTGLYPG